MTSNNGIDYNVASGAAFLLCILVAAPLTLGYFLGAGYAFGCVGCALFWLSFRYAEVAKNQYKNKPTPRRSTGRRTDLYTF